MAQERIDPNAVQWLGAAATEQRGEEAKVGSAEAGAASSRASAARTEAITPGDVEATTLSNEEKRRKLALPVITPGQEKVDAEYAKTYTDWTAGGGVQGVMSQLDQLETALTALKSGKQLSGPVVGRLHPLVQQMLYGDDPANIQATVDKVTVGSLRQILGAQFTKDEGDRIRGLSYNPTMDEASNVDRILSSVRELRARALAQQASADYFGQHGTLAGYTGPTATAPGGWTDADTAKAEKLAGEQPTETVWQRENREGATSGVTGGAGETFISAQAKAQAAALEKAWREGASVADLQRMNADFGSPPLDPAMLKAAEAERAKGPKGRPVRFTPYESERPLREQLLGAAADTPGIGQAMSFAASTAPTAALDEFAGMMGGDPEATRLGLDYLRTKYPVSGLLGDVAGNAAYSMGLTGGLTKSGMRALPAAFAAETGMGAARGGFGAREGERLAGATIGAGEGMIYGAIPTIGSRMALPQTPASVRAMREAGVPMSVGQTLGVPSLEANIAKVTPGGGDVALAAQGNAFDDFQRAYLNEATSHIGTAVPEGLTPTARFATAQNQFNEAYDAAKSNMSVRMDPDLRSDVFTFRDQLQSGVDFSEDSARRLANLLDQQVVRRVGTKPSGETYKDLDALLGKRRAAFAKAGNGEMVAGVDEILRMLRNNARRQSPPEAVQFMDNVDTGYSYLIRAENAAAKAGSAPGEFTPQQLLSSTQQADATARSRAFARGEARGQDFAQAGVEALGKAPPAASALERGVGFAGAPLGLPANIALGAANAPGIRPALNTLIAGTRPEWLQQAGRAVAESPSKLSGPISAVPMFGDRAEPRPADINALLAEKYGVQAPAEAGQAVTVGPDVAALTAKYAAQQQPAAAAPLMVPVAPATVAPADEPAPAAGEVIDKETGRGVAFNEDTGRWFYTDTGEDAEAPPFAKGGRVHKGLARALKG